MSAAQLVHGRTVTYNRHGCRCDECRTAATEARRRSRRRHAGQRQRDTAHSAARNRALRLLIANHPDEFARLLAAARNGEHLPSPEDARADLLLIESVPPLGQMEAEAQAMRWTAP